MRRAELLQELRKMRFSEAYTGRFNPWTDTIGGGFITGLLGVSDRTFRRYVGRTRDDGEDGLIDRRLAQASHRRAPVDEVVGLTRQYRARHAGWNAKHFYAWYGKEGGKRGYTWVKTHLQACSLVPRAKRRGAHRKRRERAAWPGMMIHQDGSTH
jgi:transposase